MPREGLGPDLARELGITKQAVSKAELAGRLSRMANGKFDLDAARIQYGLHTDVDQQRRALRQQSRLAHQARQASDALDQSPLGNGSDDLRRRLDRAQTETAEIALLKLKGDLVERAGVARKASQTAYAICAALDSIVDRLSAEFGIDDAHRRTLRHRLTEEFDLVRSEFARALTQLEQ